MDLRCYYDSERGVYITGGTGFVGQNLISKLGVNNFFKKKELKTVNPNETVVHLASNIKDDRQAMLDNISMDSYVIDIMRDSGAKLIYASTNNVYTKTLNCVESDVKKSSDYYSLSKMIGEKMIEERLSDNVLIMRLADVFGSGQKHGNFFRVIENSIKSRCNLIKYGAGTKLRTYLYISDLVEYITIYLNRDLKGGGVHVENVGYQNSKSISEIIDFIASYESLGIDYIDCQECERNDLRTMKIADSVINKFTNRDFEEALSSYIRNIKD